MADQFTGAHQVSDVRSPVSSVPEYQRHVSSEAPPATPDFQKAVHDFAESNNSLSSIGAKVAQAASNASAVQLGYEQGKTPEGDLMPALTDFDQAFTQSYHTQADATLRLQGQKLLDESEVEMSKPARLTPDLIARTHEQLQTGLNKIAEAAPTAIKGKLQESFDSQVLHQTTQYQEKMIGEQREDQKNNLTNALDLATTNALELAKSGDVKGAANAVASAKKMAASAVANRYMTPQQARVAHESVVQASLNGHFINLATQAYKNKKYAEFEKDYAENKPKDMTNEQWLASGQAFTQQINFIEGLKTQDENLKSQQMINKIATDAGSITATEWTNFEKNVSPIKAEQVKFKYIQALKVHQSSTLNTDALIKDWSNPEVQAEATDKIRNEGFIKQVSYAIESSKNNANPMNQDQAEVQVAAAAGGKIPLFVDGLKNKLHSSNPAFIEAAAQQIHSLQTMDAGHALDGLNDQDKALYTMYESLRDSRDPVTAARDATDAVLNQDPEVQEANKQKWSNFISTQTRASSQPVTEFALNKFGMNKASFVNPNIAQVYGSDILKKYSSFYTLMNGDENSARKLTQQYVDANYGETGVNGGSYKTLHPLEKVIGFKSSDGIPYIQQDVIKQINEKLQPIKELYDQKKSNEYWETVPLTNKKHGVFSTTYDPIQIKRHMRTSEGQKTDTYNLFLQGNAFDSWDITVAGEYGMRPIHQKAPYLGIISYKPNSKAILDAYNKDHNLK